MAFVGWRNSCEVTVRGVVLDVCIICIIIIYNIISLILYIYIGIYILYINIVYMLSYISAANIITVYVGPVYYMYASSPTAGHITYMAQYKYA